MTGLSAYGNYLYLGSRNQNRVYRYTLPNITTRTNFTYMAGYSMTCDIAMDSANDLVWVASESTALALKCYDSNSTMVDYIDISLIPNARGLALDPNGHLWVSDVDSDVIHQVDLTEGVEGSSSGIQTASITPSSNPFTGPLTLQAPGVSATVSVFDIYGRQVGADSFQESWIWNSSAPAGRYVFVIADDNGNVETLDLIKL